MVSQPISHKALRLSIFALLSKEQERVEVCQQSVIMMTWKIDCYKIDPFRDEAKKMAVEEAD